MKGSLQTQIPFWYVYVPDSTVMLQHRCGRVGYKFLVGCQNTIFKSSDDTFEILYQNSVCKHCAEVNTLEHLRSEETSYVSNIFAAGRTRSA
jgi:hypothetical protein